MLGVTKIHKWYAGFPIPTFWNRYFIVSSYLGLGCRFKCWISVKKIVGKCHPSLLPTPLRVVLPVGGGAKRRQGRIQLRELILHIGPLLIVIPLKLFLERIGFPVEIFPPALRESFVEGWKCKLTSGVRELRWMRNKKRIKRPRVYPLLLFIQNISPFLIG